MARDRIQEQIENEAEFERQLIRPLRELYVATNPDDRMASDPSYALKLTTIVNFLGQPSTHLSVLDIGCNTGGEAISLQRLGFDMTAVDINEVAVSIARERCEAFGGNCPNFLVFDAHDIPFPDDSFDAVVCWEVLHHFADLPRVLREIERILKPGGRGIAFEPFAGNPYRRLSEIRHTIQTRGKGIERSFTSKGLSTQICNAGLRVTSLRHLAVGKSNWKAAQQPALKHTIGRVYFTLVDRFPNQLAPLLVTFEKTAA